jgi:hypothetical protein
MMRHAALTSTYANVLDSSVYAGRIQGQKEKTPQKETHSNSYKSIDKSRTKSIVLLLLILLQMATPLPSFGEGYSIDQLRVYAHSRIVSFNEFLCFDSIIIKESHYNYLAHNGKAYGIGQMQSKYYQSRDPYTQIDLTIKYVHTRYKTMCDALTFHRKHGYY